MLMFCTLADAGDYTDPGEPGDWNVVALNLQTSVYTRHFDPDPDHVNDQNLLALEAVFANDWLAGLTVFDNSFGQNSQFLYVGKTWSISRTGLWYFKLTGGLLHGYEEPYQDKIPLNGLGVAPAVVPTLGFLYKRIIVEAQLLGTAAMMVTTGFRF